MAASANPVLAADVAGDLRLTIPPQMKRLTDVASLEQSGEKVRGWVGPNEANKTLVSGVLKDNTLTLHHRERRHDDGHYQTHQGHY